MKSLGGAKKPGMRSRAIAPAVKPLVREEEQAALQPAQGGKRRRPRRSYML